MAHDAKPNSVAPHASSSTQPQVSALAWAKLLHRYPTAFMAPFGLLIPVSGLASGAIFLREELAPLQWAGVGLVLVGLAENVFGARMRALLRGG